MGTSSNWFLGGNARGWGCAAGLPGPVEMGGPAPPGEHFAPVRLATGGAFPAGWPRAHGKAAGELRGFGWEKPRRRADSPRRRDGKCINGCPAAERLSNDGNRPGGEDWISRIEGWPRKPSKLRRWVSGAECPSAQGLDEPEALLWCRCASTTATRPCERRGRVAGSELAERPAIRGKARSGSIRL